MDEYKFNDFVYKSNENDKSLPLIQIDSEKDKPPFVTNYYALNENSISALTNGYFYASHSYELNDYLDSSLILLYASSPIDFTFYQNILGELYNATELKKYFDNDCKEDSRGRGFINLFWTTISNIFGVISLSGSINNNLMWPHYTQECGFQLKFDADELENNIRDKIGNNEVFGLFPVNYTEKLAQINLSLFKNYHIPFFYLTNIKLKSWNYENEWRLIIGKKHMGVPHSKSPLDLREDYFVNTENRFAYYDTKIIKEITLGHNYINQTRFNFTKPDKDNIIAEPKEDKDQSLNISFLDFICDNLSDRLFFSGVTIDEEEENPSIIRTKERMKIIKIKSNKYQFTRTYDYIKLPH